MPEKPDQACPKCGKDEWELKTRPGKAGSGEVWNTGEVREWVCPCGHFDGGYCLVLRDTSFEVLSAHASDVSVKTIVSRYGPAGNEE
jgi:hypothetical protein